ncbi:MAG: hypothetical protein H6Q43_2713 [Deltaproteobacteria bacterium]|nr:hypothetical protein [Deltaproteobacteria bacterium]
MTKDSKGLFPRSNFYPATDRKGKPVLVELLIGIGVLVLAAALILSYYSIHRSRDFLYLEKIKAAKLILNHFARGAVLPLLEMDFLSLNSPFREVNDVDGLLYAFIVDNRNVIRAHTDPNQIGAVPKVPEPGPSGREGDPISETIYPLSSGTRVLNLSTPILYLQKPIGRVHLGLSLATINRLVAEEIASLRKGLVILSFLLILAAAGVFLFLQTRLARRTSTLSGAQPKPEEGGLPAQNPQPAVQGEERAVAARQGQELPQPARKQVTILFGGIKGFREYAESREPEEVLKDLDEYFSIASRNISDQGGYIDKFVGDAVIGVFESLPFQKDHAERAVRSALAMQRTLQGVDRNENPLLRRVGIGITSGIVLSGHLASRGDEKHAFVGESFKEAYLLNLMAAPGEVTLSRDVYQLIQDLVSVDPLPPLEMNEKRASWESFRLTHVREPKNYV